MKLVTTQEPITVALLPTATDDHERDTLRWLIEQAQLARKSKLSEQTEAA